MELWERSTALASLDELLTGRTGAGRVALILGEAGIGKTALVNRFADGCRGSARVLWGACDPLVTPRALGPLHDIGRQLGGALAQRLAAGAGQADLFAALLAELDRPRQRTVLVVEDVHWADEATLDLLVFLARRIDRLPALLLVTGRDDEIGPDHPLRSALAALPAHVVRRVPVAPLSRECVAERAATAGRDGAEVYRLTGGNPLLVTELLATGDGVPGTVKDLILARLRGLDRPARDLAHLVAVLPTRADPAVLAGAEDAVERCLAAGVLVPAGDGVAYRHDLLRRAVDEALSPGRRTALHRRVLALLAGAEGTDPARLVHHARLGGDGEAVLRYGTVAGTAAAVQGAHREAAAHYRAAVAYADRLPAAQRADLLEAYSFQAYLAGDSVEGLTAREAALAEREALGERERVGGNLRWVSRLAWWSGHGERARAAAVRAVEVLEEGPPGRELAMAYSNRSQLHMLADEHDDAVLWGRRARDLADLLGDRETAIHATINVGTAELVRSDGRAAEPAAMLRRAHAEAAEAGLVDHAARALVNAATALVQVGEYAAAGPLLAGALAYASAEDLDGYVGYLHGVRAGVELERLRWAEALADADLALAWPGRIGVSVVSALVARGRIQSARGEPAARDTLDRAAELAYATGEVQWVGPVAAARSEYFLFAGDPERSAAEARRGLALAEAHGNRWHAGELSYRLWLAGGPPPDGIGAPFRELVAGDWAAAAAECARRGLGYARLEALGAGDAESVAEALRRLDRLGAAQAARWLRGRLRRRGVTGVPRGPRPASAGNPAGLTARQMEVLRLLAEGLSNAEIAGRLTLSAKTVEHHISAVLDKLGVTSRGQAVAAAHRLRLVP